MSKAEMARYLPKLISKRNSMPLYITWFVTNRCNLFCEHCFYSAELNQPSQELSLEEVERFTATMDPFPVLLYSGGEPFMRKDLAEVTHAFYRNCQIKYLSIPTNGTFLKPTEEIASRMLELCPDATIVLNFSIDGLEPEHNRIRGSNKSFANVLRTFHHMKALKQKYKNLRTGFVCTFTATNQDTIHSLYDFLKQQGPDNISINLIRGTPKVPQTKNIDLARFKEITQRVQADLENSSLPGYDEFLAAMSHKKYDMVIRTYEDNAFQSICYASQIAGVIYPNGDVYPCELLDSSRMIGNIRDFGLDFRKLWKSQRNREIADWIVDTKCFCTHECNVHCNTAFNPKLFTQIAASAALRKARSIFVSRPAPPAGPQLQPDAALESGMALGHEHHAQAEETPVAPGSHR
ncbi:MAG: radical SAM protein [Leptospirales bacterium]|nr:radical SAM protein [Leptospirales bacterium]